MHAMHNESMLQQQLPTCSLSIYRHIFNSESDLRFGNPVNDSFGVCDDLYAAISREHNEAKKANLRMQHSNHLVIAENARQCHKVDVNDAENEIFSITTDMEKPTNNRALPIPPEKAQDLRSLMSKIPDKNRSFVHNNITSVVHTKESAIESLDVFIIVPIHKLRHDSQAFISPSESGEHQIISEEPSPPRHPNLERLEQHIVPEGRKDEEHPIFREETSPPRHPNLERLEQHIVPEGTKDAKYPLSRDEKSPPRHPNLARLEQHIVPEGRMDEELPLSREEKSSPRRRYLERLEQHIVPEGRKDEQHPIFRKVMSPPRHPNLERLEQHIVSDGRVECIQSLVRKSLHLAI
ncbi:unnamed protein product [Allacma fusca]|uniref:Uncharacterized protein n=1 Tax=Allacma fusca TaxID=39272 RepID=A0A8J2L7Y1_9HEXA|nr:unnamed protein product [Allacma fusca]